MKNLFHEITTLKNREDFLVKQINQLSKQRRVLELERIAKTQELEKNKKVFSSCVICCSLVSVKTVDRLKEEGQKIEEQDQILCLSSDKANCLICEKSNKPFKRKFQYKLL